MTQAEEVGGVMLRASEIERLLEKAGASGNGIAQMLASREGKWPVAVESNIGKVMTVRNRAAHSPQHLTDSDIRRFHAAADIVVGALTGFRARTSQTVEASLNGHERTRPSVSAAEAAAAARPRAKSWNVEGQHVLVRGAVKIVEMCGSDNKLVKTAGYASVVAIAGVVVGAAKLWWNDEL